METTLLFIFGLAIGSFMNVLALRYEPARHIFRKETIGGRSRCMKCATTLAWYELVPILSFIALRGRCRYCNTAIALQYPLVEILGGLIATALTSISVIWVIALYILLFITIVDVRLRIIPDGANVALGILGIIGMWSARPSVLGYAAVWLAAPENEVWNHLLAAAIGLVFFGMIIIYSRGRGMGVGDLKMAIALGLLFGYPDIILVFILAFTLGAIVGVGYLLVGARLKDAIPFGPFLALGSALTLFSGARMMEWYLNVFGF